MSTVKVYNFEGKIVGERELPPAVFGVRVNRGLIHQAVVAQEANSRVPLAHTKTRGEVRGGGKKPWRQKGTGRARQGSIRAPQWRKGGTVFGPHPRNYAFAMPQTARREALRAALAAAAAAGRLAVVERLALGEAKTKVLAARLASLGLPAVPTLLVVGQVSEALARASRNLAWLVVETPSHVSVYQLLSHAQVVFERAALLALQEELAR